MNLPAALLDKIQKGRVVLFLGAGALYGTKLKNHKITSGRDLGILISARFLNSDYKDESLSLIAELAISEHGLFDVQNYIREIFNDIEPAPYHLKLPLFIWKAIFTTNYDRMIETCYNNNNNENALQKIKVYLSNEDTISEGDLTNDVLGLFKIHGCITRTKDNDLPLILTVEQYNDYEKNRTNMFKYLYELSIEYSIVFIGHSLQDANIRNIISLLNKNAPLGQRHYLVKPGIKEAESGLWANKKITTLDCTFESFIETLEKNITGDSIRLGLITPKSEHPIQRIFINKSIPSENLIRFLTNNAEYINSDLPYIQYNPADFYRGGGLNWYPQMESLDIKRSIFDRCFDEIILKPESERTVKSELILIKGEAGAGKTVFLRQLAWHMKDVEFGCPIWLKDSSGIDVDIIKEIVNKTSERVFIFWDNASLNNQKISTFIQEAIREELPVTIITTERYNEWNLRCETLKGYVSEVYSLRNLGGSEINELISKLEKHNCLGPNLVNKSHSERIHVFTSIFERQLLVSLHEATMGERFEDIIFNEYNSIEPLQAKYIYRTICTLNRLRVPVRAGLIARIYEISFEDFKSKFFEPLERVVFWDNNTSGDIHYKARHTEIAEIVFERAFSSNLERYNEYVNILDKINISFESDKLSFRQLMRAKSLHDIFPDYLDVINIYKYAIDSVGEDPYLLQQMANFERIRPNGNLGEAIELLSKAKDLAPYDSSIYHSIATVWRDRAKQSREPYTRIKFRNEAREILVDAIRKWGSSSYLSATMIELSIDNFEDVLHDGSISNNIIDASISKIEEEITLNKQKYPDDNIISTLEARFAGILKDDKRVLISLETAYTESSRDPYIAIRLSKLYMGKNDMARARSVLQTAIERRRSDLKLNFQYAEILRLSNEENFTTLSYYYKRAFTPHDDNYQAKFWFARYSYQSSDKKEVYQAEDIFNELRNVRISKEEKVKVRDCVGGMDTPLLQYGAIKELRTGFGFISIDGTGKDIFFPRNEIENGLWDALKIGDRTKFFLGYTYSGPICIKISPL